MSGLDNPNYDKWKLSSPEDYLPKTRVHCTDCGVDLYPDNTVYVIEGQCLCEDCADDWMESHAQRLTEEDCYD